MLQDQNVFDSKKKMKVATSSNLKHKLSLSQRQEIDINQCLLHMYSNQVHIVSILYMYYRLCFEH